MNLTLDETLQKGFEALESGEWQEADKFYTAILKALPKHPDANHNMGVLAATVGKNHEALPHFKMALDVKPNVPRFWLSYIHGLINLSQINEARAVFNEAELVGVNGEAFDKLEEKLVKAEQKLLEI
tara:strand:+ start:62 stop:442 length:381 start_codon:yes stop_codon:yes gene_type:complete